MLNHQGGGTDVHNKEQASGSRHPIAIIGIGCRFPGGAYTPNKFWNNLASGVDAITEIPADRWNIKQFYDPAKGKPGKTQARWGGFVDDLDQFDPQFFGISPREAARMDPQQRLLLEVAWEAIEDAGIRADHLAGSRTSVYVGISSWDFAYLGLSYQDRGVINAYSNTGGSLSIASNRVAYCFDLRGPSASVDTACSSALVSLHLACQSIWNDGCPMALAGGVNALLAPDFFVAFSQLSMLSPDGRCKAFDARANGFVRGEGAGMVLLKPLSQAVSDNDRVYAVIRGTAVNQDGRTPGMTVPRQESQESLLRTACQSAGIAPHTIQYVEAHGTGTQVGDPIETRALGNVLSAGRPTDQPCVIGSVKTNIGHLEAGAGIASVIKVALALHHDQIPPNLHFDQPSPEIDFERLKLRVPVQCEPWPDRDGHRLAGINGFGYGGTNAHIIMQGPDVASGQSAGSVRSEPGRAQLFPLSARSASALKTAAKEMLEFVETATDVDLAEISGQMAHRRSRHQFRLVVVTESKEHLCQQLSEFAKGESASDVISNRCSAAGIPKLTFVCSGQGPQWWAMGRQLLEMEPTFRDVIERCDQVSQELGPWSLMDQLTANESTSRMNLTAIAQPAIFALQAALGEMWRGWGVVPAHLVGHSVGEVAAAYLAGVYSLEEAFRVVYHRGRCMDLATSQGRMLAVGLTQEEAQEIIAPFNGDVTIAAVNSPSSVTLSGTAEPLKHISSLLEKRQVFCRQLEVEYAFHSCLMDPARDELLRSLNDIRPAEAAVPLISTVTGDWVEGTELDAEYWWQNVRKTVRFADAIAELATTNSDVAVELSPHPVLAYSVTECYQQAGKQVQVLSSLKRETPELNTMLRSLGQLHTIGYPIDWDNVVRKSPGLLQLPKHPWQRQSCWFESTESRRSRFAVPAHPLLGVSRGGPQPDWQCRLDVNGFTYLADHRVQGMTIFPAAGYVEIALAAASAIFGKAKCRIRRLRLANPCILSPEEPHWLETRYEPADRSLRIHSRLAKDEGNWTLHAEAECTTLDDDPPSAAFSVDDIRQRCLYYFDRQSCYDFIARLGLDYGPTFQGVVEGWRRDGEAIGIVEIPAALVDLDESEPEKYLIHPALLDACFHIAIPADEDYNTQRINLYLPVEIGHVILHRPVGSRVVCHTRILTKTSNRMVADFNLYDNQGHLMMEVRGLVSQRVNGSRGEESLDDLLYEYVWKSKPLEQGEDDTDVDDADQPEVGRWIVFADRTGVGAAVIDRLKTDGHEVAAVLPGDYFSNDSPGQFQIDPGERDDMLQLLRSVVADNCHCHGIIHLWNLDAPHDQSLQTDALEAAQESGVLSALHLVQAWDAVVGDQSTRLLLVTRGAQSVNASPEPVTVAQSPLIGLGRVIVSEYPKFRCRLVDLDPSDNHTDLDPLVREMYVEDEEDEVAIRDNERFVHRFVPVADQQQEVPSQLAELPYRLEIHRGGTLDDLALHTVVRRAPAAGEVEIVVSAAALNFSDVMKVLGLYPGLPDGPISLGAECSGVITQVGEGVEDFSPGDTVIAVAPFAFGSHVIVSSQLVAAKPPHLSFEEAATIPIAFLTAAHALHRLAHIEAGERVLIHSASGGVGLAAIQLAQRAGAEIFATAGTAEKREFLEQLGIQYVTDSRSLEFAERVMSWTDGHGVDAILNSLAGEAIPRGIETLATGGRFLELGKRDIYQNARLGLSPFRNNLAFFAVDLDQLMRDRPDRMGSLLRELTCQFSSGQLTPLPHTSFDIADITEAFRLMRQGKHVGKIVVSMQNQPQNLRWGECETVAFDPDATYLVTGGLGGFGLALTEWLVDHGARHLALMGRRGVPTAKAREVIESLTAAGTTIHILKADVTRRADVVQALDEIQRTLPPLRGVFHAAMVLEDGLLLNLDRDWMRRVMAPKVNGTWNLHTLTQDCALDYFVLFSSLSSVFGHAGQGNYAAANAFLDAMTYHRRALGSPCLTVNWGYLGDVGYLAEREHLGERLERQGVKSFTVNEALDALERALQRQAIQISVMRVDWSKWRGLGVTGHVSPRFAHLLPQRGLSESESGEGLPKLDAIRSAPSANRPQLVDRLLRDKAARLLGVAPERLDGDTPLLDLGLDSLMAVEMRNWIESQLQVDLPVVQLMRSTGLSHLMEIVCDQFTGTEAETSAEGDESSEEATPVLQTDPKQLLAKIDQLSSDEVDQLLTTLLDEEETALD